MKSDEDVEMEVVECSKQPETKPILRKIGWKRKIVSNIDYMKVGPDICEKYENYSLKILKITIYLSASCLLIFTLLSVGFIIHSTYSNENQILSLECEETRKLTTAEYEWWKCDNPIFKDHCTHLKIPNCEY